MSHDESISFVVGAEKGLRDLLLESEVTPLLKGALQVGASGARLVTDDGDELWGVRDPARIGACVARLPLFLEGEPVGVLQLDGDQDQHVALNGSARLLQVALQSLIANNLKRMLTTEIHTQVVNQSYEELLQSNRQLSASEARYRELAESLEQRVRERTADLQQAHAHLLQQEKMAAVGQLAAGVAHEINNPLGFVTSNLHTLQKYVSRFVTMLETYRTTLEQELPLDETRNLTDRKWQDLKLDMVLGDVGDLLSQSLTGAERVTRIVADLKGFSHIDEAGETQLDLNRELERTLSVLCHELEGKVEVVTELGKLPPLTCQGALAGQIFLNIIQNALQARPEGLQLTLGTAWDGERIRISIADNGPGIPREIRGRIFEPFFTTREVGAGKGMGLAVVYDAVLRLGGTIAVGDAPAGGADFIITIPVAQG